MQKLFSDLEEEYLFEYQSSTEIDDFITLLERIFNLCKFNLFLDSGLLGESKIFISTEYFYKPGDRPKKLNKEQVLKFDGSYVG